MHAGEGLTAIGRKCCRFPSEAAVPEIDEGVLAICSIPYDQRVAEGTVTHSA